MAPSGHKTSSAKLANGEQVFENDHVYVSPPWAERDGTPYWVARIIEFLPANGTPKKGLRNGAVGELNVRLSLYYRPSDVSSRNVSDFRVLLAAIHTDVQPLTNVRGKCYVRHKDRIDDLIKWKHLPDHFYFSKFYDPYIKREFEVIRTESVHNVPKNVKEVLLARYEYLLTEREMVADLTDTFRSCCVCEQWAASQESVRCEACKKHYHMQCLNPPLLAKPAKGYSWVCITCSLQRLQDVQEQKFHFQANGSAPAKPPKLVVKAKTKVVVDANRPDVTFRGWAWRYFGLYTRAQDTIDSDDLIFPRAATRVGQKFQAVVPTWEEQQAAEMHYGRGESEAGPSRHLAVERGFDAVEPDERKHEPTITLLSRPKEGFGAFMNDAAELKGANLPQQPYDVERLNRAAFCYCTSDKNAGADPLRMMNSYKLADFNPIVFSEKETTIFESELNKNGGLDAHETAKALGKRPAEVLRFSYIWKNKKLKLENDALRQHRRVTTSHARQNKTLGAPSLGRIRGRGTSETSDDEVSLYGVEDIKTKMQCAACSTRISDVWWRTPRTVHGEAMCQGCGAHYRKYGVISFVKSDDSKKLVVEKKEVAKKGKGDVSGTSTPVPQPPPKLPPCSCCRRMEPKSTMARCKTCTFSVHAGCYGIPSQEMGPQWECELCMNARLVENHLQPRCVLCPRDNSSLNLKNRSKRPPAEFDIFAAMKPTEGRRWAHLLCSAWIPEIIYTNPASLKTVEGITSISRDKWEVACSLCGQSDGAKITCTDCDVVFHVACAWLSGFRFGFEFSLAKPGRKEVVIISKFKEGEGVMTASCWCKSHDLDGRVIYDMYEVDPEQNETALQVFAASYKSLDPHDESFPTLRKAMRVDQLLPGLKTKEGVVKVCSQCEVDISPLWHEVEGKVSTFNGDDAMEIEGEVDRSETGKRRLCHLCYCRSR